jgi:hypothetical protein
MGNVFILMDWLNGNTRYLGVAFQIHGKTHYRWARLSVANDKTRGTLTGLRLRNRSRQVNRSWPYEGHGGRVTRRRFWLQCSPDQSHSRHAATRFARNACSRCSGHAAVAAERVGRTWSDRLDSATTLLLVPAADG